MALASVLILEDDSFARTTLEASLELAGFETKAVSNAKSAIGAVRQSTFEVALLDIDLGPGPTGIDVAHALRNLNPLFGLVFLTSFSDPRLSKAGNLMLPKGARYLSKPNLKDISSLGSLILQAKFHPLAKTGDERTVIALSDHQLEVIKLVAAGLSNSEIAKKLSISDKAVEHVVTRICKELGITNSSEVNSRVLMVRAYSDLTGKSLPST
ncbi:MAG: hypothetical protein RLZZ579_975 [Actinomycetota bacterium]|jgi:DNA-binding NarL/FixJ family response regulator